VKQPIDEVRALAECMPTVPLLQVDRARAALAQHEHLTHQPMLAALRAVARAVPSTEGLGGRLCMAGLSVVIQQVRDALEDAEWVGGREMNKTLLTKVKNLYSMLTTRLRLRDERKARDRRDAGIIDQREYQERNQTWTLVTKR